ncbi:transposase [Verrucomicrobiales bacterium]|nr:transposase [Verrucomicrobiales bacterium]
MKKKQFTKEQIIAVLKESDSGIAKPALCRKHGISAVAHYRWKSKYRDQ